MRNMRKQSSITIGRAELTIIIIMVIMTFYVIIGNRRIEVLEWEYGITDEESFISWERIPLKEQIARYIEGLPLPIEKHTMEQKDEVEKDEDDDLPRMVEGIITPTIQSLETSAYCSCEQCCGKTDGITASGKEAVEWCTVAAGMEYELGTIIYIPDLQDKPNGGWFVVQDRGGAISNGKLDIYMSTHSEALQYGRKTLECWIFEK